jgi:hypothetical protein
MTLLRIPALAADDSPSGSVDPAANAMIFRAVHCNGPRPLPPSHPGVKHVGTNEAKLRAFVAEFPASLAADET